jgi:hypothetical protein
MFTAFTLPLQLGILYFNAILCEQLAAGSITAVVYNFMYYFMLQHVSALYGSTSLLYSPTLANVYIWGEVVHVIASVNANL